MVVPLSLQSIYLHGYTPIFYNNRYSFVLEYNKISLTVNFINVINKLSTINHTRYKQFKNHTHHIVSIYHGTSLNVIDIVKTPKFHKNLNFLR